MTVVTESFSDVSIKYERMPPSVDIALRERVRIHLAAHGDGEKYDLIREAPEFARWLGRRTGTRGEKRFDRILKDVRTRSVVSADTPSDCTNSEPKMRGGYDGPLAPENNSLTCLERIERTLIQGLERLEGLAAICDARDVRAMIAISKERLRLSEALVKLQCHYAPLLRDAERVRAFLHLVKTELTDNPEAWKRAQELLDGALATPDETRGGIL